MSSPDYTLLKQAHAQPRVDAGLCGRAVRRDRVLYQRDSTARCHALVSRTLYALMGAVALQGVLGVALYVGWGCAPLARRTGFMAWEHLGVALLRLHRNHRRKTPLDGKLCVGIGDARCRRL
ncbi:MAG UNVERIFIED_CONTAM: hypothetical protein LVT10_27225 [Anaerolineae bacterium]